MINSRLDRIGQREEVAEAEGARTRQRLVTDHEARVQHGSGRVLQLVPAGPEARLHESNRERVAGIA